MKKRLDEFCERLIERIDRSQQLKANELEAEEARLIELRALIDAGKAWPWSPWVLERRRRRLYFNAKVLAWARTGKWPKI